MNETRKARFDRNYKKLERVFDILEENKFNKARNKFSFQLKEEVYCFFREVRRNKFIRRHGQPFLLFFSTLTIPFLLYEGCHIFRFNKFPGTNWSHSDYSKYFLVTSDHESRERQGKLASINLIEEGFKSGDLDFLSWITLGRYYSENNQPQLAIHCFNAAHLKDPKRLPNNSKLPFETQKGGSGDEDFSVDDMIRDMIASVPVLEGAAK